MGLKSICQVLLIRSRSIGLPRRASQTVLVQSWSFERVKNKINFVAMEQQHLFGQLN